MTTLKRTAVYGGSFDPITNGHQDIIERAAKHFDNLIVGIGINSSKNEYLIPGDRKRLVEAVCKHIPNVTVQFFPGLLVNFCKEVEANVIIRGLRSVSDFEYELLIANTNKEQNKDIETLFLVADPIYSFVSSSMVKELFKYGGNINRYVHNDVLTAMEKKRGGY
jgi:pantetheine-phosphate adenylyltransferase